MAAIAFFGCLTFTFIIILVIFTGFHSTSKNYKYSFKSTETTLNLNIEDLKAIMTNNTDYKYFLPPVAVEHIEHLEGQHFTISYPILGRVLTTLWMNPKLVNNDENKKIIFRFDNDYFKGHFLYTLDQIEEKKTRVKLEVEYGGKFNFAKTGLRIIQSLLNDQNMLSIHILGDFSEFMWRRIEKEREGYVDDAKNTGKDLEEGEFEILDDGKIDL